MKPLPAILAALVLSGTGLAFQTEPAQKATTAASPEASADAQAIALQLPSYPLTVCPVSSEPLDSTGKPVDMIHEGRLVRFCCKSCVKDFKKDPAPTLKAIDEAVIKAQKPSYPLAKCPVSDEELGAMGDPFELVHGTRLVRLCCKSCVKGFQKEPAKFMAEIDAALIAEQKKTYPITTCLVSGKPIEGEGADVLYGTRLARFCCAKCVPAFEKEPGKYLAQLDGAKKN